MQKRLQIGTAGYVLQCSLTLVAVEFFTYPSQIETLLKLLQPEVKLIPVLHDDRKNYKYEWESAGPTSEHAHHVRVVLELLAPLVITNWQSAGSQKCQQNNHILTSLQYLSQDTTAALQTQHGPSEEGT
jgi:hypothetical protein